MVYDVEFPDGTTKEYTANTIAIYIYTQIDQYVRSHVIFYCSLNFKKENATPSKNDTYITNKIGCCRNRQSTLGWKCFISCKDGIEQLTPLKLLKESNPLGVAEFATVRGIDEKLAFSWWIPRTLLRCYTIISTINKYIKMMSHKYGVKVTASIEHIYKFDAADGNHL